MAVVKATNQHMFLDEGYRMSLQDEGYRMSLQSLLPLQLRKNMLAIAFRRFHVCAKGIVFAGPDSLTNSNEPA